MAKIRELNVADRQQITPNMVRMVLDGGELSDFPEGYEGGYVKLLFGDGQKKPVLRSYTVSAFSSAERSLTLDIVAHGDSGPAATWANHVELGQSVKISGPGPCKTANANADWFLMAGDMSAMPAISVNLASLACDAIGHVVIEGICEDDIRDLQKPQGVILHWVINSEPERHNTLLQDAVIALPWQKGQVGVWVAGEFGASRALRQYFRNDRQVPKAFMYVSCYWKIGATDEGMKIAKMTDVEPW